MIFSFFSSCKKFPSKALETSTRSKGKRNRMPIRSEKKPIQAKCKHGKPNLRAEFQTRPISSRKWVFQPDDLTDTTIARFYTFRHQNGTFLDIHFSQWETTCLNKTRFKLWNFVWTHLDTENLALGQKVNVWQYKTSWLPQELNGI